MAAVKRVDQTELPNMESDEQKSISNKSLNTRATSKKELYLNTKRQKSRISNTIPIKFRPTRDTPTS